MAVVENPYTAAQRFLAANELPMSYLDQVVQFIEKNTGGVSLTSTTDYVDPFTGKLPDVSCYSSYSRTNTRRSTVHTFVQFGTNAECV